MDNGLFLTKADKFQFLIGIIIHGQVEVFYDSDVWFQFLIGIIIQCFRFLGQVTQT